jgi:hypothetical protein
MSVKVYSSSIGKVVKFKDYEVLKNELESIRVDAELFDFWVKEATFRPGRIASALAKCVSTEDYRNALTKLRKG